MRREGWLACGGDEPGLQDQNMWAGVISQLVREHMTGANRPVFLAELVLKFCQEALQHADWSNQELINFEQALAERMSLGLRVPVRLIDLVFKEARLNPECPIDFDQSFFQLAWQTFQYKVVNNFDHSVNLRPILTPDGFFEVNLGQWWWFALCSFIDMEEMIDQWEIE